MPWNRTMWLILNRWALTIHWIGMYSSMFHWLYMYVSYISTSLYAIGIWMVFWIQTWYCPSKYTIGGTVIGMQILQSQWTQHCLLQVQWVSYWGRHWQVYHPYHELQWIVIYNIHTQYMCNHHRNDTMQNMPPKNALTYHTIGLVLWYTNSSLNIS